MIKTEYGSFDGDRWEKISQMCFKAKFLSESYFEILATPGDYGIEGFTRSGKAFQCYCPDNQYPQDVLYEKQRDKITADLNKLKTYESALAKKLGSTKIKQWHFVTPYYSKNDIIDHCTKKRDEVRAWKLSIIDNDHFEVINSDIDFLKPEIHTFLKASDARVDINPTSLTTPAEHLQWKGSQIPLVKNAERKHTLRFSDISPPVKDVDEKVDQLTNKTVSHFLDGQLIIKRWQNDYPEDYEKFVRIVSQVEEFAMETCMFPTGTHNEKYSNIKAVLKQRIESNFTFLEDTVQQSLCDEVMADWILRCPIDFE